MMKIKIDAGDWEYLTGKKQYIWELGDHPWHRVSIRVSADAFCEVHLEKTTDETSQMYPLWSGTHCDFLLEAKGFTAVHVRSAQKTQIAVSIAVKGQTMGEDLDPTPVAVSMKSNREETVQDIVRREMRLLMGEIGADPDLIDELDLDPLDGDFSEEDDDPIPGPGFLEPDEEAEEDEGPPEDNDQPEDEEEAPAPDPA